MRKNMQDIANFLFEVGMLKRTPRTGLQFLGTGNESVAEHAFRVTFIGYVLAQLEKDVDENKLIKMCLVHDLHEARTGDRNYMNKKYVTVDEEKAVRDLTETLPFGDDIEQVTGEFNKGESKEALLANDADQLDLILMLKEHKDLGNKYADEWICFALKRLRTDTAISLANTIIGTDSTHWWFKDKGNWWVNGGNPRLK
jgi:putative hydrolase of HD superfamily